MSENGTDYPACGHGAAAQVPGLGCAACLSNQRDAALTRANRAEATPGAEVPWGSCARCDEPGGFKNACGHRFHTRCWQEHYPDCEPCRVHWEDEHTEGGALHPAQAVTP